MKLETKFLIIAVLAIALAIPVAFALQQRTHQIKIEKSQRNELQIQLDTKQKIFEQQQIETEKLKQENDALQKQIQAKHERAEYLAKLEFPVGNAPAWKVRDALAFYLDKGLSKTAAAYLVGNLVAESNLDHTNKSGDGGLAHGLAQWHPNRRHDMPAGYHDQLAFVLTEMQRTTPEAYKLITSNPTPYEAAQAMKIFEGYGVEGGRNALAQSILKRI